MAINYRRGIFRIKVVLSVILPVVILCATEGEPNDVAGIVFSVAGLWIGCWLIEKIGRWIIRGFTQTDARKTK